MVDLGLDDLSSSPAGNFSPSASPFGPMGENATAAGAGDMDYSQILNKYRGLFLGHANANVTNFYRKVQERLRWQDSIAEHCGHRASPAASSALGFFGAFVNETSAAFLQQGSDSEQSELWFRTKLVGYLVGGVAAVGLLGNLISLVTILSMKKKKSLFHNLLLTLTLYDMVFLGFGGLFFVQRAFRFRNVVYDFLFPKVIYPLAGISMTGSTYTCLAIALERFRGICHAQSDFNIMRKTRWYVLITVLLPLVIDCPRFIEIEEEYDASGNFTDFGYSEIRKNQTYIQAYTLWFRLFFTAVIPFVVICFFNIRITIYYKKNSFASSSSSAAAAAAVESGNPAVSTTPSGGSSVGESLRRLQPQVSVVSNAPGGGGSNGANGASKVAQERVLFWTFFFVSVSFLLCHLPRCVLNGLEIWVNEKRTICQQNYGVNFKEPNLMLWALSIEKLLLTFQSSVNFVIYCLVGKSFRQHMFRAVLPARFTRWAERRWGVDLLGAAATTTAGTGETTMGGTQAEHNLTRHRSRHMSSDLVSFADEKRPSYFLDMMASPSLRTTKEEEVVENDDEDKEEENVEVEAEQNKMLVEVFLEPSGQVTSALESPSPSSSSSSSPTGGSIFEAPVVVERGHSPVRDPNAPLPNPNGRRRRHLQRSASFVVGSDEEDDNDGISPTFCSKGSECSDRCSCSDYDSSDDESDPFVDELPTSTHAQSSQTDVRHDEEEEGLGGRRASTLLFLTSLLSPTRSYRGARHSGSSRGRSSGSSRGSYDGSNPPVFV